VARKKRKGKKRKNRPHPRWDRVSKSNYLTKLFDVDAWLKTSDRLRATAKIFERRISQSWKATMAWMKDQTLPLPKIDVRGVHFMLNAYAVENLFKAALIQASQPTAGVFIQRQASPYYQEFMRTGELPDELRSHDLFALAQKLGIKCGPGEEDLLRRLTRAAEWYGRYPVPISSSEFRGDEVFSSGKEYAVSYEAEDDVRRLRRMFVNLEKQLGRVRKPRRAKAKGQ
jgi:hypothetical protein